MSKHTPGPWLEYAGHIRSTVAREMRGRVEIDSPVASVAMVTGRTEENSANARLIAAAPEMYEALSEVANWMLAPGDGAFSDESLERLCRILAKIEGRA